MYTIDLEYPRYDNRDAIIGAGYRRLHPYVFHTLGLALKFRMKYYNAEDAYDGVVPVVRDERGRVFWSDYSRPLKPVDYNDEIPF